MQVSHQVKLSKLTSLVVMAERNREDKRPHHLGLDSDVNVERESAYVDKRDRKPVAVALWLKISLWILVGVSTAALFAFAIWVAVQMANGERLVVTLVCVSE